MKRKIRGLFFSIGIAGSLILGGCGKEEKEPVTITMIHAWGGTGEDHVAMGDIYDGFQKENPDIEVQLISMPGRKEMLRKVEDMIMVGDMPDVITFSGMGQNTTYDFIVENNMALDIMPYVKKDEEFASNISQTNLNYWTTEEGELFTVSDVLSLSGGYWYNEDILHAAGVKEIPRTWMLFAVCATKSGNGRNVRIMKLLRFRHLRRAIFILWIICFWRIVQKRAETIQVKFQRC